MRKPQATVEEQSKRRGWKDPKKLGGPSSQESLSTLLDEFFPEKKRSTASRELKQPSWDSQPPGFNRVNPLDPEIRWLERQSALGLRTADVAHEIRNALVSFKTFVRLLPDHLDNPEFMGEFRDGVNAELARLERLLDAVLHHAQPGTVQGPAEKGTETAPVIEAVEQLLRRTASQREIELTCRPGGGPVALSRDALQQVLLNLTLNALEATPAGGQIVLSTSPTPAPGWIELWLDDDGEGVSEDDRERLFSAFQSGQRDRPGGLGLSISRGLVGQVGGEILADRSASGGARMVVRLPCSTRA